MLKEDKEWLEWLEKEDNEWWLEWSEKGIKEAKEDKSAKYYYKKEKYYSDSIKQTYVDEFLSMKCCGDVLNVANPIGKKARKEITESMALIKKVKKVVLSRPWSFRVLDLCAGNALTSLIAVHLFHNVNAFAFDKRERQRQWDKVRRFEYIFGDIYDPFHLDYIKEKCISKDTIIVSSHPCGELARHIINIYKQSEAKALFLMPCCDGKLRRQYPDFLFTKMGHYFVWAWDLALDINAKLTIDERCISPKNIVISHVRSGK